ncbi:MAG: hypothetical protein HYV24_11950 [Deltaproteobacteria bacterium]|nr:hypothetical protein [Deltaproteobacteria bacterium]
MRHSKVMAEARGPIRIVAAGRSSKVVEYEVREFSEPGSIPNWFMGVVLLLRDEIQEDEKIVVHDKIIKIVKKTPLDRLVDWVRRFKTHGEGEEGDGDDGAEERNERLRN